jgi:glutaconate CoA-transferase subunit B
VTATARYTASELMIAMASRALRDRERVLVGVGQPNLAANLAKRLHAPGLVMVYEAGVVDANPARLPLSIGDPCLVSGAVSVHPMLEAFTLYLQGGLIDTGFLGAAQVDRYGNLNSTVIGDYAHPKARLAGSGGAGDIATLAGRVIVMTPHQPRRFPERVDFVTTPGNGANREGLPGGGTRLVITDVGILEPDETGELVLTALHEGRGLEEARARTGWDLRAAGEPRRTDPPTEAELATLRALDPDRLYLGGAE